MSAPNALAELRDLRDRMIKARDSEVSELGFVLPQYVTDHHDRAAFRYIDQQVNAFAREYDKAIDQISKTIEILETRAAKLRSDYNISIWDY